MATERHAPPITTVESDRVRRSTEEEVRRQIDEETARRIEEVAAEGSEGITRRLEELDGESDIERYLEINASALALTGITLAATMDRRWMALPAVVTVFLLQHGVQGWCPPIPVFDVSEPAPAGRSTPSATPSRPCAATSRESPPYQAGPMPTRR